MIGGSFHRLKDRLRFEEEGETLDIQRLMVNLYNFQISQMGITSETRTEQSLLILLPPKNSILYK